MPSPADIALTGHNVAQRDASTNNGARRHLSLWLALLASASLALVAIAANQPLLAVGAMLVVPAVLLVFSWPEAPTPLVLFLLYSNAAVVAVRYHNVPTIASLLVPLVLLIPLGYHLVYHRRKVILPAAMPAIALFLLVQTVGAALAIRPDTALDTLITSAVEGFGIYFVIVNVVRTPDMLRRAITMLLAAGALMGGVSGWQQATGNFHKDYGGFGQVEGRGFGVDTARGEIRQPRLSGPIGEKNRFAQIMLMLVPIGLFHLRSQRSWPSWLWVAGATFLSALGCALAFSRGAAVGFVLLVLLASLLGYIPLRQLGLTLLVTTLVLAAVPQYAARLVSLESIIAVASGEAVSADALDGAMRGRATVMLAAARVFADHPLLGVGPGMFNFYAQEYGNEGGLRALETTREAHNLYLEIAAEHGVLGLLCFALMLGLTFRELARTRRRLETIRPELSDAATGFLLALATYLATGLFLHFSYVRYFWLILALASATTCIASGVTEAPPEARRR